MITSEQRDWVLAEIEKEQWLASDGIMVIGVKVLRNILTANTAEDESLWLSEAGFCGTCAFFHREPRCPGGICGRFESKPQVEIVFGCEEYETDKDYENYWLNKED